MLYDAFCSTFLIALQDPGYGIVYTWSSYVGNVYDGILNQERNIRGLKCNLLNRAWDFGEEEDKEVEKFPFSRGDNKPRRCEQHF